MRLGLGRMRALLGRLGDPQLALRGPLVGGTNGKGSTQAMVAAVLGAGGLRVGQSPSPHLASYRERIVVGGRPIERPDLDAVLEEALVAAADGERRHGPATEFELLIAGAFLWFARVGVDVAIMEVGLGGRLDATNTWDGGVAAITNVGLDHQEHLGPTVEAIAREKAAIIKRGDHAVTGATDPALAVISRRAARLHVPLQRVEALPVTGIGPDWLGVEAPRLGPLRLGLTGRHQAANAAVALGIIEALDAAGIARVDDDAIRRGFASARWPGRLETLDVDGVTVVLDGAHNPDGAAALVAAVSDLRPSLPQGRVTLLLGILADKEVAEMLATLASDQWLRGARLVATDVPETRRSLAGTSLAERWGAMAGTAADVEAIGDLDVALDRAMMRAREAGGPLIVAGSLYLVGHARARLLGEPPKPDDEAPRSA
jgi:dihydrofolate synthase / folylpolyglutamate synthase